jgi:Flp pilus assembly protein TadG
MCQPWAGAPAHLAKRLGRDRRGNVMMMFGLFGTIAFVTVGGALDYGRWMHARYHTARALDAAVLAGGRALQTNQADPNAALVHAKHIYDSNIAGRFGLKTDTVQFVTADNNMAVTASGQATMATTLLGIIGIAELPVAGTSGSKFPKASISAGGGGSSNMEIALMLDVTGSMCDDGVGPCDSGIKIDALRDAAKELVDIVVQADQSQHTSKVALVPFSTRVRVGPDGGGASRMNAMTNLPATWSGWYNDCTQSSGGGGSEGGGNWSCQQYQPVYKTNWKVLPCVTDRMYGADIYNYTDAAPQAGNWLNAHGGDRRQLSWDITDAAMTTKKGLAATDPADHWNFDSSGGCTDVAENNEIMPLSSDKSDLKNKIDQLQAYGSTSGALGTAFAWYMLSPNWSSVWGGTSAPGPYSDLAVMQPNGKPKLRKVAVLMSDGVYNTFRGWKDQDQQTVSDHAKQLCTNMKAAGVEIYAVAFDLDSLPAGERAVAEDTLRTCGSDLAHFYSTLTVAELKNAFKEIAMSLTTVYLSE